MIQLRILGTPNLRRTASEGANRVHLQPKRLALLAYLALAPTGSCRRDTLLALFWPDLDEAHARNALSQSVHWLRRTMDKAVIISQGAEELRLSQEILWCDVLAFQQALQNDTLTKALEVYRGPLLDGLHVSAAPAFEYWLEIERERLHHQATEATASLSEREEVVGNPTGAVHWLRRLLELAPDNEVALKRLMNLLDGLGDRTGALRAYQTFTRRLAQDLDLTPAKETQAFAARLQVPTASVLPPGEKTQPSVAVLPFDNLSADPEQAYFCDGMTEEIINVLAQNRGLRVAARTTVFAFKNQSLDFRDLAQKLGVDFVIEGSVRRAGGRLRITVQLINATDGYHLWSARYDRAMHDIFAIQDEIAQSVAETLHVALLQAPEQRALPPTQDMEAHTLYLKGLFLRRRRTPEDIKKACASFQQAIARDPNYAQAYAALAFTYALGGWFLYDVFAPHHAYPLARDAAEKALALNNRLSEAHLALAYTYLAFEWDGPGAEDAFKQALALDPDNLDTIGNYASYLVLREQSEEALALTKRGEVLDPFWIMPRVARGIWLLAARRYEEAIDLFLQTHEMEPRLYIAPLFLGDAYLFTDRLNEAHEAYQCVRNLIGRRPIILGRLGALYAKQHQPDEAHKVIAELHVLAEKQHVLSSIVAGIYLALEEQDQAFRWLMHAFNERDTALVLLHLWPAYDPVRADPRFQALLDNVGLSA